MVLRVCGQINGAHVDTLRHAILTEKGRVVIDLSEVMLVNHEAVTLLAFCETNGTQLRNCPAYVREWVAHERALMHADRSGHGAEERKR